MSLGRHSNRSVLVLGVIANLGLLGYYKYANFFVDNLNHLAGSDLTLNKIILPLAISFFTFQQVAYLVDAYRRETHEYNFFQYALFVIFFPQLIAGPIVHHKEILPQFEKPDAFRLKAEHLAVGITIFAIGLFKKVVLADSVAGFATPVFHAAESGAAISFIEAWAGTLSYTFQIYFDFSGYSDMAIGLGRMFGIVIPLNFNSPYKATSIVDFWRRWHMTLSRFLRDYLYIPLGGSRKGEARRMVNLMITMLLGGLWHGAGWTFVLWGGLHGIFLVINHTWSKFIPEKEGTSKFQPGRILAWALTFLAVVITWVPFRAESMQGAMNILSGMAGLNGIILPSALAGKLGIMSTWLISHGVTFGWIFQAINPDGLVPWIAALFIISVFFPNTQSFMHHYVELTTYSDHSTLQKQFLQWKPTAIWGILSGLIFAAALLFLTRVSEFLYFQF